MTPIERVAVVTGAGSGVGRAVALKLAAQGWNVALVGRTEAMLRDTTRLAPQTDPKRWLIQPCDICNPQAVAQMAAEVLAKFGVPDALVNSAGTNAPQRALAVLSLEDYHRLLATNLHGAYYCLQAFLPAMRQRRAGTIVNVVSDAGKQASPKAGPAYVVSKFGLAGLSQSINAEERHQGIRACAVFPGDIDTPLLEKRPEPPSAEARRRMLRPEDVADCILLAINLPPHAILEEIVVRPA